MSNDPFVLGLKRYFDANPSLKEATVSAAAGLDKSTIRKMFENDRASPRVKNAHAIAQALGHTVEHFMSLGLGLSVGVPVSVAGRVSAGDGVELVDAYAPGAGRAVQRPDGLPSSGVVAVEVSGDSMEPIYSDGDILFYSRSSHDGVPSEAMGRKCICSDADGDVWVKLVKPGEETGRFHLISLNPSAMNRLNVPLVWAAPVILHWPKELATFVEPQEGADQ